jgi:phospholipid-translocating ATPase
MNIDYQTDQGFDERGFFVKIFDCILKRKKYFARSIFLNGKTEPKHQSYPQNVVRNQKYNIITFLPLALYEQFKFLFVF